MSNENPHDEVMWLKSLDRRDKDAPAIDVASSVMREIHRRHHQVAEDRGLPGLAAVLASLMGAAAAAIAIVVWLGTQDPMNDFMEPLRLVLQ